MLLRQKPINPEATDEINVNPEKKLINESNNDDEIIVPRKTKQMIEMWFCFQKKAVQVSFKSDSCTLKRYLTHKIGARLEVYGK